MIGSSVPWPRSAAPAFPQMEERAHPQPVRFSKVSGWPVAAGYGAVGRECTIAFGWTIRERREAREIGSLASKTLAVVLSALLTVNDL